MGASRATVAVIETGSERHTLMLPKTCQRLTLDEFGNSLLLLQSLGFSHKIDLVLQDQDIPQLHDFDGGQMLRGLGLRTRFVSGNKQKGGVHDGGTGQHGSHENVVSGTVDERDVPAIWRKGQLHDERRPVRNGSPLELHGTSTPRTFTSGVGGSCRTVRLVVARSRTSFVVTFEDLWAANPVVTDQDHVRSIECSEKADPPWRWRIPT